MKASSIEFRLRGIWIGVIFWISFSLYWVDSQNLGALLAEFVANCTGISGNAAAHLIFGTGAAIAVLAALLRTWAASYLTKEVVHDARLHSDSLVADGPENPGRPCMRAGIPAIPPGPTCTRPAFT